MIVSIVIAVSDNSVIGRDNGLPWHLPADLKFFKKLTTGHTIIMGRKTFESIGKPLPNRRNIVVSRGGGISAEGIEVAASVEEALELCKGEAEAFIIGGAAIYSYALAHGLVHRIYLTRVRAVVDGDTFFTLPDASIWKTVSSVLQEKDEKNTHDMAFEVLERK